MSSVKRTLLVRSPRVSELAAILTGYGSIDGIDHEGTITYSIEGPDEFELGRLSVEIEQELNCYDRHAEVITAVKPGGATAKPKGIIDR